MLNQNKKQNIQKKTKYSPTRKTGGAGVVKKKQYCIAQKIKKYGIKCKFLNAQKTSMTVILNKENNKFK